MDQRRQTVQDIVSRLQKADAESFAVLERSLASDTRKGIQQALKRARHRLQAQAAEQQRLEELYTLQAQAADGGVSVGLDEVGRGPLAGPLTVAAVVLPEAPHIAHLNDSKQLSASRREEVAAAVKDVAIAWSVQHIAPEDIDDAGMSACLRRAFGRAVAAVETAGVAIDVVLLDGNPLHFDVRERTFIKGDARLACIAAASVVAKVERDELMTQAAQTYPVYGFDRNKGYGSAEHIAAIKKYGLCPLHRRSFCHSFVQESLF